MRRGMKARRRHLNRLRLRWYWFQALPSGTQFRGTGLSWGSRRYVYHAEVPPSLSDGHCRPDAWSQYRSFQQWQEQEWTGRKRLQSQEWFSCGWDTSRAVFRIRRQSCQERLRHISDTTKYFRKKVDLFQISWNWKIRLEADTASKRLSNRGRSPRKKISKIRINKVGQIVFETRVNPTYFSIKLLS